jgi:hypothetical protein
MRESDVCIGLVLFPSTCLCEAILFFSFFFFFFVFFSFSQKSNSVDELKQLHKFYVPLVRRASTSLSRSFVRPSEKKD